MRKLLLIFIWLSAVLPLPAENDPALGIPGEADVILEREGFVLGFCNIHKQSLWVGYTLTAEKATARIAEREHAFKVDPELPSCAAPADYRYSGYDRGHLAPAADMAWSEQAMKDCFMMSNVSPQLSGFNRGIWKRLEEQVRYFAITEGVIDIVTGPILPREEDVCCHQVQRRDRTGGIL